MTNGHFASVDMAIDLYMLKYVLDALVSARSQEDIDRVAVEVAEYVKPDCPTNVRTLEQIKEWGAIRRKHIEEGYV